MRWRYFIDANEWDENFHLNQNIKMRIHLAEWVLNRDML